MKCAINENPKRRYTCMDLHYSIEEDKVETHQVIFELFHDLAPKTCERFCMACCNNKDAKVPGYKGSDIHRVVKGMFVQGGRCDGASEEFEDESFHVKHTEVGLLGMCKRSGLKHTNAS